MRVPFAAIVTSLVLLLAGREATATIHFTDIRGREVVVHRGPVLARVPVVAAASRRTIGNATVTVSSGPDTDAANNDYRRIQNAINAAVSGDTIILSGTFDFTAPFAAAAWALGNDNTAGTADDFEVSVPNGLNSIILTAAALGDATIQGPGDLAAVNLESFLVFDGGPNQSWTISNLRILDFDLSIGLFATPVNAFNNFTIQNNFIRIPTDLNATVAPADVNQNIGINFSFGMNQSIVGNSFQIAGTGVSDIPGGNFATSVVMQSNTSGGNAYDGLTIANNVTHVLGAQSASPERILGIWENGHAHTSNISITNNSFINDSPGNDPTLNDQRAFRVTSHSSATTTVTYSSNHADGASIGFEWLAAVDFSGNQAVVLLTNQLTNSNTGVLVQSNGIAHLEQNVITGSHSGGGIHVLTGMLTASGANPNGVFQSFVSGGSGDGIHIEAGAGPIDPISQNDLSGNGGLGLRNDSVAPTIVAIDDWWGSNLAAAVAAEVSGNTTFDPWLASGTDVSPAFGFQPFIFATTSGTTTTFAGTGEADTGALLAGDPVTMVMNGQTAFTALAQLVSFVIQLGGGDDVFTLGQTGIPTTFDGGTGNDTLVGTNVAQTWNITGPGSGNIPGAADSFVGVEALRGGTAADSFIFGAAGSIAQTVDGNLGIDTLDNSAIPGHTVNPTGPGTLDGFMGTASGIGGAFDNINLIAGSPSDLAVTKSGPPSATAGTVISYTIGVTNNGPNPAINATLTDTLPAGTTFVSFTSAPGWSCTTPAVNGAGTVTCTEASMPVGTAFFTLNVNAPQVATSVSNTASVSESNTDPTPGNNSSTATTAVVFTADLSVVKTAPASIAAGTNLTYTITVTNNGPSPATGATLTDVLPANATFVSEAQTSGPAFSCTNPVAGSGGTVSCSIASLLSGASATFTLAVQVAIAAPAGPLSNTASVTTSSVDPTPGNNSSTATTTVTAAPAADLSITKTAGAPPFGTGRDLAYTIVVGNAGPASAASAVLTDVLPAGTTFVSATPSQGSCSGTATVTCALGTIASGGSATITLHVTLPSTPGPVSNTATITSANPDPNPANNTSTATVSVVAAASIPAASPAVLLLLALALGFVAMKVMRR
jgi:uncharacterized repeat protein (TIGR01451 family)